MNKKGTDVIKDFNNIIYIEKHIKLILKNGMPLNMCR